MKNLIISRGQFVTTYPKLAVYASLTIGMVRRGVDKLAKEGFLRRESVERAARSYLIITIENYEDFQDHTNYTIKTPARVRRERDTRIERESAKNNKGNEVMKERSLVEPAGSPTKRLIDLFYEKYKARTGKPYVVDGAKEGAIFKRLVGTLGEEDVRDRMGAFFESHEPFLVAAGYTVGVFASQINKLVGKKKPMTEAEREAWWNAHKTS